MEECCVIEGRAENEGENSDLSCLGRESSERNLKFIVHLAFPC